MTQYIDIQNQRKFFGRSVLLLCLLFFAAGPDVNSSQIDDSKGPKSQCYRLNEGAKLGLRAETIRRIGSDVSDLSGQYNLGVYVVETALSSNPTVIKLEPQSVFERTGETSVRIQNILAGIGLAPKVLGVYSYAELDSLQGKFHSEIFLYQKETEAEFVGILMERLPEGWNTKAFFDRMNRNSWQFHMDHKSLFEQIDNIEATYISKRIDPGMDLQLYVTRSGKVFALDFMTYKFEHPEFSSESVKNQFLKLKKFLLEIFKEGKSYEDKTV